MTPSGYSKLAKRLFPFRWQLFGVSMAVVGLIFASAFFAKQVSLPTLIVFGAPLLGLSWSGLCTAVWFHPERGYLQPSSKIIGRLPEGLQAGVRWYAALFLTFFLIVGCFVMPLLVFTTFTRGQT